MLTLRRKEMMMGMDKTSYGYETGVKMQELVDDMCLRCEKMEKERDDILNAYTEI